MDKQNLPCNFLDLNQEFIKHFRMAMFVIKIRESILLSVWDSTVQSCQDTREKTRHRDPFEAKSYSKTQVLLLF